MASACSASKMLELDPKQILAAIGLAAGACGALTRDGGTMAKPFRCGHAAATGVTAALLAQAGFSSDETVVEGRYGLLEAIGPLNEDILDSLGKQLGSEWDLAKSLRIKPFASCTATHSGLEAMLRLVQREKIVPDEVKSIHCDLRPYPLVRQRPGRGYEGRFSMAFCLAVALVRGEVGASDFTDERLQDVRIQHLIQRTHHEAKEEITVILTNGRRLSEPFKPATNLTDLEHVRGKFADSVRAVFSENQTRKIEEQIACLEDLPSIGELTRLLQTT